MRDVLLVMVLVMGCVVQCLCSYKTHAEDFRVKCPDVRNLLSNKKERERWRKKERMRKGKGSEGERGIKKEGQ